MVVKEQYEAKIAGFWSTWLRNICVAGLGGGLLALCPSIGSAATPQDAAAGHVDPALQREQFESLRRQQIQEEQAERKPTGGVSKVIEEDGEFVQSDQVVTLSGIRFSKSVFLKPDELESLASAYIGKPQKLSDLKDLLKAINARYRGANQLTARAFIAPQDLHDGVLRVLLIESKVDHLTISGEDRHVADSYYMERLSVSPGAVLDTATLMTAIQRFNATTVGPTATVNLAPGSEFASTNVDVEVVEPPVLQPSVFVNNYGPASTGRDQMGTAFVWFSPTRAADSLTLYGVTSRGSNYLDLQYARPVNVSGGSVYVDASDSKTALVGGGLEQFNIKGEGNTYTLGFDQPWWLSNELLFQTGVGATQQHTKNSIGSVLLSEVEMNEIFLRGQLVYRNESWYAMYEQKVRNADSHNLLTNVSGNHWIFGGRGYVAHNWDAKLTSTLSFGWQKANSPAQLPAGLSYALGGMSSVRGYDSGSVTAPGGYNLQLGVSWKLSDQWRQEVFSDYAKAMDLGVGQASLSSIGTGLSYAANNHVSVALTAVSTLNKVLPTQEKNQVLLQVTLK